MEPTTQKNEAENTGEDLVRRQAARTATVVAVPLALAVAAFGLWSAGAFSQSAAPPTPTATPSPTTAVAQSAVTMAARQLDGDTANICRGVVAKLPDTVLGSARRPVTAGAEQNAAYGEPPVTLTCGVAPVTGLAPTAMINVLGGVCWFGRVDGAGTVWTTVDREVPVAVKVPLIDGSGQWVIPFAKSIGTADPLLATAPGGCQG